MLSRLKFLDLLVLFWCFCHQYFGPFIQTACYPPTRSHAKVDNAANSAEVHASHFIPIASFPGRFGRIGRMGLSKFPICRGWGFSVWFSRPILGKIDCITLRAGTQVFSLFVFVLYLFFGGLCFSV